MLCSLSTLDQESLEAIQDLEKKLGKTLLSFSCHPFEPAEVKALDLHHIGELEKKLNVVLVAVK